MLSLLSLRPSQTGIPSQLPLLVAWHCAVVEMLQSWMHRQGPDSSEAGSCRQLGHVSFQMPYHCAAFEHIPTENARLTGNRCRRRNLPSRGSADKV